ncbi:MAG: VCBS repeat-containing protein, partial [Acidimicrobiia bacterium]|nr:VCBS repeat-containing protein [Acidimicrobiia bacterium]
MTLWRPILALALTVSLVAAACSDDDGDTAPARGWEDPAGNMLAFSNVAATAGIELVRELPPPPAPPEGAEGTPSEPQGMPDLMDPAENAKATLAMRGGAAVLDYDRDGWLDLFVVGADSGPDRLYRNNGDGTFSEVGAQAGVALEHLGSGAAAADFDGDGWTDLHVTSHGMPGLASPGHHRLYRNRGDGTFEEIAGRAGVATPSSTMGDGFGSAFGDVDLDG